MDEPFKHSQGLHKVFTRLSQAFTSFSCEGLVKGCEGYVNILWRFCFAYTVDIQVINPLLWRPFKITKKSLSLTEILQNAMFVEELPAKRNTRNQKQFEKLLVMRYGNIKLTVGLQRSNQDLVQYCITVPQIPE